MRRIMAVVLLVGCAIFIAGLALGQSAPSKAMKAEPKGAEYHHLLMLDLNEAAEHARTLNHYARMHSKHLEKDVLTRHVDELTRNLEGMQTELAKVEENRTPGERPEWVSSIRRHHDTAQRELDALKTEVSKDDPQASVIESRSRAIHESMVQATVSHHQLMAKRGIHKPQAVSKEVPTKS